MNLFATEEVTLSKSPLMGGMDKLIIKWANLLEQEIIPKNGNNIIINKYNYKQQMLQEVTAM